jgi:D-alanyl-D-alanine dipeptidase
MYIPQVSELGTEIGLVGSTGTLFQQLKDALSRGAWSVAIAMARARGVTDENALTDMVFYARYPAMRRGSALTSAQRAAWISIRNDLVRPALARATVAPAGSFRPVPVEARGGRQIEDRTAIDPAILVPVKGYGKPERLHPHAAAALAALQQAARAAGMASPLLLPVSTYRDPKRQLVLWNRALKKYGSPAIARKWVAPPGHSTHQTGRAIDFHLGLRNSSANVARLRTLPTYQWLVQNAARFGFYPYPREPWHWEYNPQAA